MVRVLILILILTYWSVHVFCQLDQGFSFDLPPSRIEIGVIKFKHDATLLQLLLEQSLQYSRTEQDTELTD
jgi:hypothetical protein